MTNFAMQTQAIAVASGATVSSIFAIGAHADVGLVIPSAAVGSQAFLQVGAAAESASMVRATNPEGSGDWIWNHEGAGKAVSLARVAGPFPFARLEFEAAPGSLEITVLGKRT